MTGDYYVLYTHPGSVELRVMRTPENKPVIADSEASLPLLQEIADKLLQDGIFGSYRIVREC